MKNMRKLLVSSVIAIMLLANLGTTAHGQSYRYTTRTYPRNVITTNYQRVVLNNGWTFWINNNIYTVNTNNTTTAPAPTTNNTQPQPAETIKEEPKTENSTVVNNDTQTKEEPIVTNNTPKVQESAVSNPTPAVQEPVVTNSVQAKEAEVVRLVNIERSKKGLKPLAHNTELSNVARTKSQDMANKGYFSHTSPTYGSPFDMMKSFGIKYSYAGENIAAGYTTPEAVVNGWMNSQGHKDNILSSNFTEIGVGYAVDKNGKAYWTQMFIRP